MTTLEPAFFAKFPKAPNSGPPARLGTIILAFRANPPKAPTHDISLRSGAFGLLAAIRVFIAPARAVILALLAVIAADGAVAGHTPPPASQPAWSAPLDRAISVRDGRTNRDLTFEKLLDDLAQADVVFLGESHTDETTHQVELAVYDGLLARRSGKVALAMEMFERDVQPALDDYLAGKIDEPAFLKQARPWGNYNTAYRPLIERAKAGQAPVIASNFPMSLRRKLATDGPDALTKLDADQKRQAPAELLPETSAYWRRADNAVRSHRAMMAAAREKEGDEQRLFDTQSLWDNAMGESCALALDAHPGFSVLHVNGGFHSAYWDGAVRQLKLRRPQARVLTVAITPVANPQSAEVHGAPEADFVVFAHARATDIDEGAWSVFVSRGHKYRLHLPSAASADHPVPLLIWLGDDGLTASDGLDLWKSRLGDAAALAVIEPLYPQVEDDLSDGGRWFRADTFSEDTGAAIGVIEGAWGYLLRHFPIDPAHICLAGEGSGATVVAATTLLTDRMEIRAVAIEPRQYSKIKDFPLPLREPGDDPPPARSLRVITRSAGADWWRDELAEYKDIGLQTALDDHGVAPLDQVSTENALRAVLGLSAPASPNHAKVAYVLIEQDSPRAQHWARLRAIQWMAAHGGSAQVLSAPPPRDAGDRISIDIHAASFTAPGALPKCPGPFGGTTLIVLPAGTSPDEQAAWLDLQKNDPINKESRFHRLRIASETDGQRLPDLLAQLHEQHRDNVLIVPAVFCADAAQMHSLKHSARDFEDTMTLQWLPGVGGRPAGAD